MKRIAIFICFLLLVVPVLLVPAFASPLDDAYVNYNYGPGDTIVGCLQINNSVFRVDSLVSYDYDVSSLESEADYEQLMSKILSEIVPGVWDFSSFSRPFDWYFDTAILSFSFYVEPGTYQISSGLPGSAIMINTPDDVCEVGLFPAEVLFFDLRSSDILMVDTNPFTIDSAGVLVLGFDCDFGGSVFEVTQPQYSYGISRFPYYIGEPLPDGQIYPDPDPPVSPDPDPEVSESPELTVPPEMELLATLLGKTLPFFQFEFTIWGFTFSFWKIMLFSIIAGIVICLIWRFMR